MSSDLWLPSKLLPTLAVWCLLVAVLFAPTSAPLAQAIHVDVSFQENDSDGRFSIHGRDFNELPANRMVPGKRVFGRSVEVAGNSLVQNDPGFTASDNSVETNPFALGPPMPNENVLFNVLAAPSMLTELGGRNLSYWDGDGVPSWGPVPDDEGIEISEGSDSAIVDGSTMSVPGFAIGATDDEGGLHKHIDFLVLPDNGQLPQNGGPDDGVYLMMWEATQEPYAEWVPFFLFFEVFAGGRDTVDEAIADIEARLLMPLCSDGIDNDRDGLTDFAEDFGCEDAEDMSERGALEACDNGLDDDLDGRVDFPNDKGCAGPSGVTEVPEPGAVGLLTGCLLLAWLERRRRP